MLKKTKILKNRIITPSNMQQVLINFSLIFQHSVGRDILRML